MNSTATNPHHQVTFAATIVLGSQSPRRHELLNSVVADERLLVMPPMNDQEAGFDDCRAVDQIENRIREIVSGKNDDVLRQVQEHGDLATACVVCADTIVVVKDEHNNPLVLGKPPEPEWKPAVRDWFQRYYSRGDHEVWTCIGLACESRRVLRIVKTRVLLAPVDDWWLEWYLDTDEPRGKAGGYGIQGLAAHFVESVDGSLTNVIGLPMLEVVEELRNLNVIPGAPS